MLSLTDKQSSNNQPKVAVGDVRGRALYDFTSDCDEELCLQVKWLIFLSVAQIHW